MSPELIGVLGLIILLVLIFLRVPVGLALFLVGFLGVSLITRGDVGLAQLSMAAFGTANDYNLSVIPLFILMGMFLSYSGLGKELFSAVNAWFGRFRGGLAIATIGASSIFASISGSSNATTATIARVSIPEMNKYNYKTTFSTAAVAAGGTLGSLIPPSVILIIYGALTNVPIGSLLIGGFVPGLLLTLLFILLVHFQVRLNPSIAPIQAEPVTLKEKMISLKAIWPFLLIFLISIGGIYLGVFTPSEAGGIGAILAFFVTIIMRRLSFKNLIDSLDETLRLTVMIFLIFIGANLFGSFLALSRIPAHLTNAVVSIDVSKYLILALILIVYMFLGMFLEGIAIMTLTLPIVYPIITSLGFDGLWFGIIMVIMINIGVLTPPLGLSVYIISGIVRDVPIEQIFRGVIPAICIMVAFTVLLIVFPEIITFLPSLAK
ncbi:TRAP transporter large permease [Calidifontibacillus erzurumensis]|uniref:TRAP transporter large permease n=1 Tax=Calidifontibacillus erzurumensis TaxID=2741433 RepID=A0A8J8GE34_9BACI|nr:TRAP transporter large permease [Calidifontibacillus erzurumensis]NSL50585.1 TRAP transporter large permease [Calidifontibacillus erzurumensis]